MEPNGKNLNVTNCAEYLETTIRQMTDTLNMKNKKKKKTVEDLHIIRKGIAHADYFKKLLPKLVEFTNQLCSIADTLQTEISEGDDTCDSRSWSDMAEYGDIRNEIRERDSPARQVDIIHFASAQRADTQQTMRHPEVTISPPISDVSIEVISIGESQVSVGCVDSLTQIPPAIYRYSGDAVNSPGLYICLSPNVYVQLPFMRVLGESDKHRTERCFRGDDCVNPTCTGVHPGAPYFRMGNSEKCKRNPSLGNAETLAKDIREANFSDIKTLLMHTMSDLATAFVWFQENKSAPTECVLHDIDICQ